MDQRKNQLITKRIIVYGLVQGVGFRPLVYHIANKLGIKGTVRNLGGSVEIIAQATEEGIKDFLKELCDTEEGAHEIIHMETERISTKPSGDPELKYTTFTILNSGENEEIRILPPDRSICPRCEKELSDPNNRRYQNPFISCTACGPRYTIIDELPYDRDTTTMVDFNMCNACEEEYQSSESRRHHAQTISCHDCGPFLIFQDNRGRDRKQEKEQWWKLDQKWKPDQGKEWIQGREPDKEEKEEDGDQSQGKEKCYQVEERDALREEAFQRAVEVLLDGGIIAVKGIGGYHFVCSPFAENTVQKLRLLKGREEKPFAVMFPHLKKLMEYCEVSMEEEKLLCSFARPIVLLYGRKELAPSVNKGSINIGAFLPYTPLQQMLTQSCGPLIMTSANLSGQPIIKEDEKLLQLSSPYLDGVLYHRRRILHSVDDSVGRIIDHQPQMIRRGRGYTPTPILIGAASPDPMIFAAGGDLKAAFCLYREGAAFVSQAFGDMEEMSVITEYKKELEALQRLLRITPALAICDLHPNYQSTRLTKGRGLPLLQIQHHHAHIASVMAEHRLSDSVIGVAFDGTGYGLDGHVWGGEFFLWEGTEFKRVAHLDYIKLLGGDESMKDARKTATCYLAELGLTQYIRDERSSVIQAALKQSLNCVQTSSMGRLFDVVASILEIGHYNHYEGECAALLEKEAVLALKHGIKPVNLDITVIQKEERIGISVKSLLEQLCCFREKEDVRALALGFHYAIAKMLGTVCELLRSSYHLSEVVLSGGVFVNKVLTEEAIRILEEKEFGIYRNIAVPTGDGGISLGQTYLGLCHLRENNRKVR